MDSEKNTRPIRPWGTRRRPGGRIEAEIIAARRALDDDGKRLHEARELIAAAAALLDYCPEVYADASDTVRRMLNQVLLESVEVVGDKVVRYVIREPFRSLLSAESSSKARLVEVAGIEPASFGFLTGLLRAQPAEGLGPVVVAGIGDKPQSAEVSPSGPLTRPVG